MTVYKKRIVCLSLLAVLIAGCGDDVEQKATGPRVGAAGQAPAGLGAKGSLWLPVLSQFLYAVQQQETRLGLVGLPLQLRQRHSSYFQARILLIPPS